MHFLKQPYERITRIDVAGMYYQGRHMKISQAESIGPQDIRRTSPSPNVLRTSPKDSIWSFWGRPEMKSSWLRIWRSRNVPGRLIQDVPRSFWGRSLEDLQSTQTWMKNWTDTIDKIYLKAFQRSRCIEKPVKRLRQSIFCKISKWLFSH